MARRALLLAGAAAAAAAPTTWVHPGVLVSPTQLAHMAASVKAGGNVIADAFAKAVNSKYALGYQRQGPPADHVIQCGSYSNPNLGCSAEDDDASAAYLQLLLFNLTGDARYAASGVAILDAYSALQRYTDTNAPLQAAWGMSKWVRAAELARHLPGVNWPQADADAFTGMLYRVGLPLIHGGSDANGNWELSMIEGMIGLAVLSENATLFDHAAAYYGQRVPAYFYNFDLDGGQPRPAPRGDPGWYGQTVFNATTSGVCQETCRDEGHSTYSVAAASNAAETAFAQGVDLWSTFAPRLATSFDFNAHLLLPGVDSPAYLCSGERVKVAEYPGYVLAYNALARRLGYAAALGDVAAHLNATVLPMPDPVDPHMMIYEALTHGA